MFKNRLWANPWVLLVVIAGLLAGLLAGIYFVAYRPVTTVILVRHAEKNIEPNNPDPTLTPAGQERTQILVRMLGESGITAIYATQYLRTQGTASPLADSVGLKVNQLDARNVEELVRQIKMNHLGGVVFVAGHSNSVPAVISALGGGTIPEIPESEYDNMFIVTVQRFRQTRVLKLKYGNPSASAGSKPAAAALPRGKPLAFRAHHSKTMRLRLSDCGGVASSLLWLVRKGRAFPQGMRQSRSDEPTWVIKTKGAGSVAFSNLQVGDEQ